MSLGESEAWLKGSRKHLVQENVNNVQNNNNPILRGSVEFIYLFIYLLQLRGSLATEKSPRAAELDVEACACALDFIIKGIV